MTFHGLLLRILFAPPPQEALGALDRFTVDESSCYSDVDRAALTSVICEWYTDRSAGEDDPRRLAEIGKHKFESFVRHNLAPSVMRQQEANLAWLCLLTFVTALEGIALAQISAPSVSVPHAAMLILVFSFISIFMVCAPLLIPRGPTGPPSSFPRGHVARTRTPTHRSHTRPRMRPPAH